MYSELACSLTSFANAEDVSFWRGLFAWDDGFSDVLPLRRFPHRLSPYPKRATLNSSDLRLDIGQKLLRHVDACGFLKA